MTLGPIATNAEQHPAISGSTHDTFTNSSPTDDGWRDRQVTVPSSSTLSQGLQRNCQAQANLLTNAPIARLHFCSTRVTLVLLNQSYLDCMFCWRNSSCFRSEIKVQRFKVEMSTGGMKAEHSRKKSLQFDIIVSDCHFQWLYLPRLHFIQILCLIF